MRSKEDAHDYRYFPDPDLTPVWSMRSTVAALREELPELPGRAASRFRKNTASMPMPRRC